MTDLFSLERFDRPIYLWLLVLSIAVWWFSRRSLSGLGPIRSKLSIGMRCLVILLLVLTLAGTHKIRKNDDLSVLFIVDESRSISPQMRRAAESFIVNAGKKMQPNDRLSILTFDGQARIEQLPSRRGADGAVHVALPLAEGSEPDHSNLAAGLRVAAACALDSTNNRVVLLSDGNQNVGEIREEAKSAKANNLSVDVVPLRLEHGAEIVFEELRAPAYANLNEQIALHMTFKSDVRATGQIMIFQRIGQEEKPVDLGEGAHSGPARGQRVTLNPGRNPFVIHLPIKVAAAHEFAAQFVPDDPSTDSLSQNNVARAFTNVEGPQRVLFIGTRKDREDDQLLIDALAKEHINVDWEFADSVNIEPFTLQDYTALILSNVPAENFSATQQQLLANYVREMGGGLVMVGGDESFGAGGWQGSIVEDIMPVKFDVDAIKQIPRGALAIVMHSCEMPQGNMWGVKTAQAALATLSRLDYFGVVGWGFAGYSWEVKMQTAENKEAILTKLGMMQNADMMDFDTPMRMAYNALINCKDAAQRHMIIISDGDPAPPSSGLLSAMVGNKVTCSAVSIFPHGGAEISTMKHIADVCGGHYYSLNQAGDEKHLPKIFTKEARTVRRPLLRDEVFTPTVRPSLSEIMAGVDQKMPPLKGYVVTTPRKVADVEMPLVTSRGDPLLAHWLVDLGRTVAFTSGRWKHWGSDWPEWSGFSKFWAQSVRWCMQQGTAANYDVNTTVEGGEGHVVIESLEDSSSFSNFRKFNGRVIGPDGKPQPVNIVQTGPGRYEGRFKVGEQGNYQLGFVTPGSKADKPTLIRTGISFAYSPEFRDLSTNEAVLSEVADETSGRVLNLDADSANKVFAHNLRPTISRTPIWDTLLKLAIIAFLLDVAVRRIAIDPLKGLARARAYIGSLPGRLGTGRAAQATLTDLKSVREKVRAEQTGPSQGGEASTGPVVIPGPSAGKKFEAGPGIDKPAEDLVKALGGDQPSIPEKTAPTQEETTTDNTMSRLLKAKKRAQSDQDEGTKS